MGMSFLELSLCSALLEVASDPAHDERAIGYGKPYLKTPPFASASPQAL